MRLAFMRAELVIKAAECLDLSNSKSAQFVGRAIVALTSDVDVMEKPERVFIAGLEAKEYGVRDIDGKQPWPLTAECVWRRVVDSEGLIRGCRLSYASMGFF
jgi:hypothetical protein